MSKRIDVNDLNVYYGNFRAVEGVNINIEAKERKYILQIFLSEANRVFHSYLRFFLRTGPFLD